ncbi:MAG: protein kinase domain-containing protein [Archangium sp.]
MAHLSTEVLTKLTRGELGRDDALAARRHLAGCDKCSNALDRLEKAPVEERKLGRYVLLDEVGRGGMGLVLRGFDPQLDRFVAIKRLLDAETSPDARERLVREAQAMARVVHPNLVSVFDAGLDPHGGVYLVMEFVKGPTLAQWLSESSRTWRQILQHFAQAGRGLAAAHAAGLVHRDFKPSNVLVQNDVAKVTDFGLALAHVQTEATGPRESPGASRISSRVTQAGVNAGTPAYMAPEQFEGRFDARSDQFTFARTLDEALTGTRAPRWVHEALRKALSVEPAQRYPSMDALLEALSLEKRTRRATIAISAVVMLALLGVTAAVARTKRVDCSGASANLETVWSSPAQRAVEQLLTTTDPRVRDATRARFSAWADEWRTRSVSSCEASASGAQGERVELLRRLCLDRRLGFFGTVLREVALGAVPAERVVSISNELPHVGCTDEELLAAGAADESDALRAQLQPVRKQLEEVQALALIGELDKATAKARETLPLAETTGHSPTIAHAAVLLAQRLSLSNANQSRALLQRAVREAGSVKDPSVFTADLAARAGLDLLDSYLVEPATFEALRPMVEALIARAGGGPEWEAAYLTYQGRALSARGEGEAALKPLQRAYALRLETAGPDSERSDNARVELANAAENAGDIDTALALRRTSLETAERVYGSKSLVAARARAFMGAVEVVAVRYADAEKHLNEALEILTEAGATEDLTTLLDNLASLAELRGDFRTSLPLRRRSLEKLEDPVNRAKQLALISRTLLETGDEAGALEAAREAREIFEPINVSHPDLIVALTTLGRVTKGKDGEALLERALALESSRDGEYRGDLERAMAAKREGAAKLEWLKKARASYAESEVSFRVQELDAALR